MTPLNLALRFALELTALAGIGMWAWQSGDGFWRYLFAFGSVVAAMALWGVFNVPDDPSRSGHAPVVVAGWVRLILELCILCAGAAGLYLSGYKLIGSATFILIAAHYAFSLDRIAWLLQR